jgi:excisionase family DNA binding protein
LIADVTVLPEPGPDKLAIGIRWHTGATDEVRTPRPLPPGPAKRTPSAATQMIIRLGPVRTNDELVAELIAAGLRTGHGNPFDVKAVQWIRHVHQVKTPSPYHAGEISVQAAAERLDVSTNVIYYWIDTGQLSSHRGSGNRHRIPWTPDIEADCRRRITDSAHLTARPQTPTAGEAV